MEEIDPDAFGSPADITVVERLAWPVPDVLSLTGWTPYAGRTFKAKPMRTILRGKTIYLDGKVVGEKGYGKQAVSTARRAAKAAAKVAAE